MTKERKPTRRLFLLLVMLLAVMPVASQEYSSSVSGHFEGGKNLIFSFKFSGGSIKLLQNNGNNADYKGFIERGGTVSASGSIQNIKDESYPVNISFDFYDSHRRKIDSKTVGDRNAASASVSFPTEAVELECAIYFPACMATIHYRVEKDEEEASEEEGGEANIKQVYQGLVNKGLNFEEVSYELYRTLKAMK